MAYFKYLPKVYVRNKTRVDGFQPYQLAVNIFRRIKIRDELQGALLGFIQYEIGENERPDQVAYKFYKDSGLDWVILLVNNVINVNQDWPMNREDLYKYVEDKYGSVEGVRHYETLEYLHTDGSILLKSGYQVPEDFQYIKPDGSIVPAASSRIPVSYYAYESEINETKRNIYLLRPQYLTDFIAEFKKLAMYLPNAEVDENGYKKTQGSLAEEFIGLPKYNKPSQSTASTGSASGGGSSTSLVSKGST
tara:strand:- start:80 stop:826 length:747 start_codon:yes stop_codon:yes gene_type:complete